MKQNLKNFLISIVEIIFILEEFIREARFNVTVTFILSLSLTNLQ